MRMRCISFGRLLSGLKLRRKEKLSMILDESKMNEAPELPALDVVT